MLGGRKPKCGGPESGSLIAVLGGRPEVGITAIYARVSTDEQAEHGTSLDEQLRLCRQRAPADAVVEEFVDAGLSGTTLARPQLQSLLQRARCREIAGMIAYDPDRLSRNAAHLLFLVDELRAAGVEIEFVNFVADSSPDGRLLFTVRGAISEFEAVRIKQRMYSGKQARARANQVAAGTCIYGYRLNRSSKTWELDAGESQVVRLLFEWALDAGTSDIARRLNERGVPARFGGRWHQSSVLGILRNATYTGRMPQMGGLGFVSVPPLVTVDEFERVRVALRSRRNRSAGRAVHPYLLTGRLLCGVCGRAMCGGYGRPTKTGTTTYYGCAGRAKPRPDRLRCGNRYWRSDELDRHVWEDVLAVVSDPAAFREVAAAQGCDRQRLADLRAQQEGIVREQQRVRIERERLLRGFRRGVLGEDDLRRQCLELDAERRVLEERAASVATRVRAATVRVDDLGRNAAVVGRIVEDVPGLETIETRRSVLAALGVRVAAGPDSGVRVRLGVFL